MVAQIVNRRKDFVHKFHHSAQNIASVADRPSFERGFAQFRLG